MDTLFGYMNHLVDPDWIMHHGGLFLVLLIIFAETGLFAGFFLPGDSLLFVSGMVIAGVDSHAYPFQNDLFNLVFWIWLMITAAVLGNLAGYGFGYKSGPLLFKRRETWLFKRKHLEAAHKFYEKKGGFAIVLARFLPIIRTFAPVIGGIVKMNFRRFAIYSALGALLWVAGITTVGFLLGENPWVIEHIEYIILGLVLVTTGPVLFKMFLKKKSTASG